MLPASPRPGPAAQNQPGGFPGREIITRVRRLRRGGIRSRVWQRARREWRQAGVRAAVFAAVITLVSADLMFMLEHRDNPQYGTPWDALWWSMVTMTTTGYGDVVPHSFLGRALGVFTMVSGMGLFSVLTALIAGAAEAAAHSLLKQLLKPLHVSLARKLAGRGGESRLPVRPFSLTVLADHQHLASRQPPHVFVESPVGPPALQGQERS